MWNDDHPFPGFCPEEDDTGELQNGGEIIPVSHSIKGTDKLLKVVNKTLKKISG